MADYIIPTWKAGEWSFTEFETQETFRDFLVPLFKEPGLYNFDETVDVFLMERKKFMDHGVYCEYSESSRQYYNYWFIEEKEKCRRGVIYHNEKGDTWYLPGFYYQLLNFLNVYDKRKKVKKAAFAEFRDVQYHMSLYEFLAQIHDLNAATLKRRQVLSTYIHDAILFNKYIFEEMFKGKIGASDEKYIKGGTGCWRYLDDYSNFTNMNTAWIRENNPGSLGMWIQRAKGYITDDLGQRQEVWIGNNSSLSSVTFDKDPASGVGGACMRKGTKILMSTGFYKEVQEIEIGETVMGIDNKPKSVTNRFHGIDDIYSIEQGRGETYYTTGDHILYLINRDKNVLPQNKVRLTKTRDWNKLSTYQKRCYVGVKNNKEIVFYNHLKEPTLDPYFLGIWLGDGYRQSASVIINKTKDIEILEYLEQLSITTQTTLRVNRKEDERYNDEMYVAKFSISENGEDTYFTKQFVKYNLYYNKHIPDAFLYGSIDTRKKVLAGIIDTDGYYEPSRGNFQVCIKEKRFRDQVAFLCRSLGAIVREDYKESNEHLVRGGLIKYTQTHNLAIYFQDSSIIPTLINRKQGKNIRQQNIHTSPIKEVICLGKEEYYGIQVEDSLYYLEDLTITHNCDLFYYEEGGIAPTLDQTYGYIREAQREGSEVTGYFTAAGSVGSLTQCEPLRELILYPEKNDIYPVKSTIKDELGEECLTGLFIPIYWGYVPFIDKWGNSQIAEAKDYVNKLYAKEKAKGDHGKYQLLISQGPRTIMEAFGVRTESIFELRYTAKQAQLIEDKTYWLWNCNLVRNLETGKVEAKEFPEGQKREPNVYPSPKTKQDKRGCVTIHEKPIPDAPWLTYYGSVDPVAKGGTSFSDSLAYCCIWKNVVEVHKTDADGKSQVFLEGGKLVAEYWGRFDDVNETNEMISMLVEYYNAWTICENNQNSWINHMRIKKRYRYLARKSDMLFDKEMKMTDMGGQEFGWTKTTAIWTKMLEYGLNSLSEVTYEEFDKNGDITKTHYGHERIPFINIIREMQAYNDKGNFDALVSYCALMAFIKIQQADKGIKKRIERSEESSYERNQKLIELSNNKQPFNNMGTQGTRGHYPASYNIIRRNAIKGRC